MLEFDNFDSIKIRLASPEKIRSWSRGEVKKPETINYRTLKPEREGLFCEKIFGPTKDWECHCGKYKRVRYKGVICDRCGVEVTKSKVRRERMGHIELAAPVSHIWYFRGIPSKMGILLDMSPRSLEKILYFASYIVTDAGDTSLSYKQVMSEKEYAEAREQFGSSFKAGMGAEAVRSILQDIDLDALRDELKAMYQEATGQKKVKLIRRLEVVDDFRISGNSPEWMIMDVVPVIPPDLRPMVQLDGGRFATSDLNDLYRRVINRNNRLKRLLELGAPDIIVRNEKRMLQEAVDSLIDNGRRGRPVTGPGNRPLRSLSDMLKGKQGRFRQNLLGKRVDYSGRSVIVVGPTLKFYQCGLPRKMALELFKPFVMKRLVQEEIVHNIKSAKRMVERAKPEVWPIVEDVIKNHPVLLNRAPTLHRLGIQAFEPVLVDGKAIRLHPLVCTAYNADFDGDQMAVHVPLSVEAQAEARYLMLSVNNILAPKDGLPITTPTQDMVLGAYYLTLQVDGVKGEGKIFKDFDEMYMAYRNGSVHLHAKVGVRVKLNNEDTGKIVESTVGRFIFNSEIPQSLGFVNRDENPYALEIDFLCAKKDLENIIASCYEKTGNTVTAQIMDSIKNLGFKFSTQSAITVAVDDMIIPDNKWEIVEASRLKVEQYQTAFRRGFLTEEERYEGIIHTWTQTTEDVTNSLMDSMSRLNNIAIMANSGARGSRNQIRQLGAMRGLMANATGRTVEIPILSNFREGLSVLEYFISTTGARKGLADTALRTADSGYLTRRLVDVAQDVIVREVDCGADIGIVVRDIVENNQIIEGLAERLDGRYPVRDVLHPETGEVIASSKNMINKPIAEAIVAAGIKEVEIRSVLNCEAEHGVCCKCYGRNLATGREMAVGEAVGTIAAQSIGEPGTQLTMRTFHTGGVAGADITQGLPRVEELFEGRKPKGMAVIAEISGKISFQETKRKQEVIITNESGESHSSQIVYGSRLRVQDGDYVQAGDKITEGSINPHDILRVVGVTGVQEYIVKEIQIVYRLQGVDIDDKHIEVIVRQMLSKIRVDDPGDSDNLPGRIINFKEFKDVNKTLIAEGLQPMDGTRALYGITKASLATDSFLSAASFQETTRVLTDAAVKGKEDQLLGLKENVIIGKLIPAGTGLRKYKNVAYEKKTDVDMQEVFL
ncbi:MAG: DNA-directed RNA polymerase subunit beta' [Clostridia bacterium]|nr:DNA-directed RNA polymerase subunit beta' [Clostridia bacterium]